MHILVPPHPGASALGQNRHYRQMLPAGGYHLRAAYQS
jgi:hypothetical protein